MSKPNGAFGVDGNYLDGILNQDKIPSHLRGLSHEEIRERMAKEAEEKVKAEVRIQKELIELRKKVAEQEQGKVQCMQKDISTAKIEQPSIKFTLSDVCNLLMAYGKENIEVVNDEVYLKTPKSDGTFIKAKLTPV